MGEAVGSNSKMSCGSLIPAQLVLRVFLNLWRGVNRISSSSLSLALVSCSSSSFRTVSVQSSSLVFLLMIRHSSCGNLLNSTEDRRLPYEPEDTPRDLRLRTWASMRSYRLWRPFKLFCEITGSALQTECPCAEQWSAAYCQMVSFKMEIASW